MYYGHLRGHAEHIFKQSSFGSVGHIAVDATEFLAALKAGPPYPELRIDTWCGRNYKYGNASNLTQRNGSVRNACEYCFVEYSPEEQDAEERRKERGSKRGDKVHYGDLPF